MALTERRQPPDYRELKGCLNLLTFIVDNIVGTLLYAPQRHRIVADPDKLTTF